MPVQSLAFSQLLMSLVFMLLNCLYIAQRKGLLYFLTNRLVYFFKPKKSRLKIEKAFYNFCQIQINFIFFNKQSLLRPKIKKAAQNKLGWVAKLLGRPNPTLSN